MTCARCGEAGVDALCRICTVLRRMDAEQAARMVREAWADRYTRAVVPATRTVYHLATGDYLMVGPHNVDRGTGL